MEPGVFIFAAAFIVVYAAMGGFGRDIEQLRKDIAKIRTDKPASAG
jgi:hypothetical protein